MPSGLLFENLLVGGGLAIRTRSGDQVPLVDDDDDGAPALVGVSGDGGIAAGDAFSGVDEDERYVGCFKMLARHHDRKFFGHQFGLALAADASRVDEAIDHAVAL